MHGCGAASYPWACLMTGREMNLLSVIGCSKPAGLRDWVSTRVVRGSRLDTPSLGSLPPSLTPSFLCAGPVSFFSFDTRMLPECYQPCMFFVAWVSE